MYDVNEYTEGNIPEAVQKRMAERPRIEIEKCFIYPGSASIIEESHQRKRVLEYTDGKEGNDFTRERQQYQEDIEAFQDTVKRYQRMAERYQREAENYQHEIDNVSRILELTKGEEKDV